MESRAARDAAMRAFLAAQGWGAAGIEPLAQDASFRRYWRLRNGSGSAVLMDAPPPQENVRPFMSVAGLLDGYGYSVPRVRAADVEGGFLLLDDLGDATYTRALATGAEAALLYANAIDVLIDLHRRPLGEDARALPAYSDEVLVEGVLRFVDWYCRRGIGLDIDESAREAYAEAWRSVLPVARAVPEAVVLRDFHVDNLMVLSDRAGVRACGLLDFQDAMIGPASYDVMSLLQDARRDNPAPLVAAMRERYLAGVAGLVDRAAFEHSFNVLGAQRTLRVIGGVFTRQSVLFGNHRYLVHIPRLWRQLRGNLADPALAPVRAWMDQHVPERLRVTPRPGGGMPT